MIPALISISTLVILQGCEPNTSDASGTTLSPVSNLNATVVGWLDYISKNPTVGYDAWSQSQISVLTDPRYNITEFWLEYFSYTDRLYRFLRNVEIYTGASLDELSEINMVISQANVTAIADVAKEIEENSGTHSEGLTLDERQSF